MAFGAASFLAWGASAVLTVLEVLRAKRQGGGGGGGGGVGRLAGTGALPGMKESAA